MVAKVTPNPFASTGRLNELELKNLTATLNSISEHLKFRQTSIKPFFKDFDKVRLFMDWNISFDFLLSVLAMYWPCV